MFAELQILRWIKIHDMILITRGIICAFRPKWSNLGRFVQITKEILQKSYANLLTDNELVYILKT